MQRADTTPTQFVGRERNQAQLNPEIGVTGDVRGYATGRGVQRDNFVPREFEIGFQSALDPYSHTKIFVSIEDGAVGLEEGYAYWTGLPGHIRLDVGKYRQQFGELNRWHLHAVPETEYPLALTTYLGEDGLAGTGLSVYRAFGGFGTHEVVAQITRSASDAELFGGAGRPTYLGHLLNFWLRTGGSTEQTGLFTRKNVKIGFDPFEFGIIKRRVVEGRTEEDDDWKIGHPVVFPITLLVGGAGIHQLQIRVPVDDTNTWHIWYNVYRAEGAKPAKQAIIPSYEVPLFDARGERIVDFIDGQDVAVWAGQGPIADRTKEMLSSSDAGVVMLRRMHKEQLERIAAGEDPIGTVRDPARNRCIELPIEHNKLGETSMFRTELFKHQAIRHSPIVAEINAMFDAAERRDMVTAK